MANERAHKQEDVEDVILEVLEHRGVATTAEITKAVKGRLHLSSADLQRAAKREGESKVDQIIANALQAKRRLCRDGLIERVAIGEFRILVAGKAYLQQHRDSVEQMCDKLTKLFPDADWD